MSFIFYFEGFAATNSLSSSVEHYHEVVSGLTYVNIFLIALPGCAKYSGTPVTLPGCVSV